MFLHSNGFSTGTVEIVFCRSLFMIMVCLGFGGASQVYGSEMEGFVRIPEGAYSRGDHYNEKLGRTQRLEQPVHEVYVSEFFVAENLVTFEEWREVYEWAIENDYRFTAGFMAQRGSDLEGDGLFDTAIHNQHPVVGITWHDMLKWCNAKSEKDGLTPVYYTDNELTDIFRDSEHDVTNDQVRWEANGYRLPTEVEWEKAARGGLKGKRWPWGDEDINPGRANYDRKAGGTTPVGSYPPNEYGIYDGAGNVWERVWDWLEYDWYKEDGSREPDTRGPFSKREVYYRVMRGGSWKVDSLECRVANRGWSPPFEVYKDVGFRIVKSASESGKKTERSIIP